MFTDLNTFQVEDFNPLFSDVHSGLNFSFKCLTLESENTVTKQKYIKWNNEKKTEFIEHMSVNETDSIRNIEVMIDELHVKQIFYNLILILWSKIYVICLVNLHLMYLVQ